VRNCEELVLLSKNIYLPRKGEVFWGRMNLLPIVISSLLPLFIQKLKFSIRALRAAMPVC
jgi:hypothetical protein